MKSVVLALVALFMIPSAANAAQRDQFVESFDGTKLNTHFFLADGLKPGERAPTVMVAHGYGESGPSSPDTQLAGAPNVGKLMKDGYNVLTWDARGHGQSGGMAELDDPNVEGRDTRILIDFVAKQREAQLDAPGDPRVGMAGASYGGIIQWIVAGLDPRVDVIEPAYSSHSLADLSVARYGKLKEDWITALVGAGAQSAPTGLVSPAGPSLHVLDPVILQMGAESIAAGASTPAFKAMLDARSATAFLSQIHIPTLIQQGTTDTMFPIVNAVENFAALQRNHVPVKLVLNCEGHSLCLPPRNAGPAGHFDMEALRWFDRWLKRNPDVDTGAPMEWLADNETQYRAAQLFPPRQSGSLTGTGSGTLTLTPLSTAASPGAPELSGMPATDAVDAPIPAPARDGDVVGSPHVTLSYSGTASPAATWVYAQVVDLNTNAVVGGQVTPIPVTLDGAQHTVDEDINLIATRASKGSRYELQLMGGSAIFGPQRSTGTITLDKIDVSLPLIDASAAPALLVGRPRDGRVRLQAVLAPYHDLRIVLQRRVGRRWRQASATTLAELPVGASKIKPHGRLPRGRYRALVTATDAYGRAITIVGAQRRT